MGWYIEGRNFIIDATDLGQKVEQLRSVLSKDNLDKLMHRTFREVGARSKTLIASAVTQDYVVSAGWARAHIKKYQLSYGGGGVVCKIPMSGQRGSIGGTFPAGGGGGRVTANIVRAGTSVLPEKMSHQGGNPPFMARGVAFTRKGPNRFPIASVKGLALPQMPLTRSADKTAENLLRFAGDRLEHNFNFMFG